MIDDIGNSSLGQVSAVISTRAVEQLDYSHSSGEASTANVLNDERC